MKKGESLVIVVANDKEKGQVAVKKVLNSYLIGSKKTKRLKKILYYVDQKSIKKWS